MDNYIKYLRNMVGDNKVILCACSVVIVNEKNEVLLEKRSDNHLWGLPGGLMELEESIEECAIREVYEETFLKIRLTRFLGIFNNPMMRWREHDEARVIAFAFAAKIVGGSLRVNDHESLEMQYFSKDKLPRIHSVDNYETINAYYAGKEALVEGKEYHE
ncbi:MAG TPA: NUDIX domain-containing protein [Bacillota bacterium]|nr:NUDIX domain-containing protein [Bacillota bacterium]HPF42171.1 NUDIX domain-containing protein [Bacillota bacterium]HPJ85676.1 NUDIX domain-containing protein [Bacillota bacterium]HPQ61687.1 NUDIX domain-containing protein [Bacillota bacterium]HRX91909.1 NUDIX domain-containing protein [Candidatus Izemoplasmatales bacterium]